MRSALVLGLLVCCSLLHWSDSSVQVRGPRVSLFRDASTKMGCSDGSDLPVCSDDDWGPKCPSGCRIQGLMDLEDRKMDDRVRKIRQMLDDYSKMYGSTHVTVTQAVRKIRETLNEVGDSGTTYYQLVDSLKSRLVTLQERINYQTNKIQQLKNIIFQQFEEITRMEVDIDIKIRSCKGSCAKSFTYTISREGDAQLDKNLRSLASMSIGRVEYSKPTHVFKMRKMKESDPDTLFKSGISNSEYPKFWAERESHIFSLEEAPKGVSGVYNPSTDISGSYITSSRDGVSSHTGSFPGTGSRRVYSAAPTIAPATWLDSSAVHAETPDPISDDSHFETFDQRGTSTTVFREGGREESRVTYYPRRVIGGGDDSDDARYHITSGSSSYTKTTVTKDGKTTERVTVTGGSDSVPEFLESQFDRFRLQSGGEPEVSSLGSRRFTITETKTIKGGSRPEFSASTSGGIKTGKQPIVTERHTVTHTSNSDPFSKGGSRPEFSASTFGGTKTGKQPIVTESRTVTHTSDSEPFIRFSNSEVFRDFQTFDPSQPLTEGVGGVRDGGGFENRNTQSASWTETVHSPAHKSIQHLLKSITVPLYVDETGEDTPDQRGHI